MGRRLAWQQVNGQEEEAGEDSTRGRKEKGDLYERINCYSTAQLVVMYVLVSVRTRAKVR